jgi:hypothetical protein
VGNGAGVRSNARVYPERVGCENQPGRAQRSWPDHSYARLASDALIAAEKVRPPSRSALCMPAGRQAAFFQELVTVSRRIEPMLGRDYSRRAHFLHHRWARRRFGSSQSIALNKKAPIRISCKYKDELTQRMPEFRRCFRLGQRTRQAPPLHRRHESNKERKTHAHVP